MNHSKELIKNTAIIGIGKLSTHILTFLLLPLYTKELTPAEYGTYDFLVTLSIFVVPIITLLLEESMFRFLIDAKDKKEKSDVISQTFIYCMISILFFSIICIIITNIINYEYGLLFMSYAISSILIGLSNALARGLGRIKIYSLSNFAVNAIIIGLNLFFILVMDLGVAGMLMSSVIANCVISVSILIKLKFFVYVDFTRLKTDLLKKMLKYSIPLVPNSVSWSIINLSDRIMITSFLGTTQNGIYSIANKFPSIMNSLYGFFYIAWKESASKIVKEDDKERYYNSIYDNLKRFLFSILLCLIAILPIAFDFLIDVSYKEAYLYIPVLIIAIYYSNMSGFYGGIFAAYKDTKIMGTSTIVSAIINIVINLILMPYIGVFAAVLSTIISNYIVYLYRKIKVKKYVELNEKIKIIQFILLILSCIVYYKRIFVLNVIFIIIAIIYSCIINKNIIKKVTNKILKKN